MEQSKKAIIIGSGIAGLAAALRLRARGFLVQVFEANGYPGGKIHNLESNGYRFDTGPSLFTMPHFVDELFELFGDEPREYFRYQKKETVCNYFWEDGTRFTVNAEKAKFIKEASETFDVEERVLENYLTKSQQKYDATAHIFLEKSLHKVRSYMSVATLKSLIKSAGLGINNSLHQENKKSFRDPKLVQLFDRYATYNGSTPYQTPGIMSMIPHLEMHFGTYLPEGGMKSISQSLYDYALEKGVKFRFNEPVEKIKHTAGRAEGVITANGTYHSDVMVSNADVFTSYQNLLKDAVQPIKILEQERSSSALIFYWGVKKQFPELDLHNIFFSESYEEEFKCLFESKDLIEDPTVYINITSKSEPNDAAEGGENWFVMINAPGNFGQDWETLISKARTDIQAKIRRNLGVDIAPLIETEEILDPRTIESKTSSHRGSLYGASSNSKFSAFLRHPNFTSKLKGLYFCGGSVHPGGGIPLCLLSAKIVADIVKE
ncbi:MAG: 1-hydroxycarotenoid 3,4-desaturase CrtD [Flavobacteriales bacterium]